ncbi:MAG TPA: hypothetical protein VGU43_06340 [Thermoplasmata archaeon]|nr:hypothetical protein [Thermoplasmata archaeon]
MNDSPPASAAKDERRRQRLVMLGLLVTLIGAAALWLGFPIDSSALVRSTPFVAIGALGLWIGGILLGAARSGRRARRGAS